MPTEEALTEDEKELLVLMGEIAVARYDPRDFATMKELRERLLAHYRLRPRGVYRPRSLVAGSPDPPPRAAVRHIHREWGTRLCVVSFSSREVERE